MDGRRSVLMAQTGLQKAPSPEGPWDEEEHSGTVTVQPSGDPAADIPRVVPPAGRWSGWCGRVGTVPSRGGGCFMVMPEAGWCLRWGGSFLGAGNNPGTPFMSSLATLA